MKTVRLALAGCGGRGIYVSKLFQSHPHCRVVALMDRFDERLDVARRNLDLPDAATFTEYDRMLHDAQIDAVFIAANPFDQVDMACRAMRAGKHVCTEVPVAFTIEECRELVQTVETTGMQYQPMEQTRYWGFVDAWKDMHARGEFGHICLAQGEYVHYERDWGYFTDLENGRIYQDLTPPADRPTEPTWRYRMLGDPILYLPHTLSPLLRILDDRVIRVSCMGTRPHSYTYADTELPWRDIAYALMHTAKDTVLMVGAGFSLPHVLRGPLHAHWYELRGTEGSVTSPRHPNDGFRHWKKGMSIYQEMDVSCVPADADEKQAQSGHGGADFKPVDTFIRAILEDKPPPMDVYRAVETALPAILAAQSARENGRALDVPDLR